MNIIASALFIIVGFLITWRGGVLWTHAVLHHVINNFRQANQLGSMAMLLGMLAVLCFITSGAIL